MWYEIENASEIATPALAIYPDRVRDNIARMKAIAGTADRLCPHVKTHKMSEVTRLYLEAGVTQFKCATISELDMVASLSASLAVLAYQPVGPGITDLVEIAARYRGVDVGLIVDNAGIISELDQAAAAAGVSVHVFLDLDVGMHRTGIAPGADAIALYEQVVASEHLHAGGLHIYDGHIHDSDFATRCQRVEDGIRPALAMRDDLLARGHAVPRMICGGSPSFPCHAAHVDRVCSPGTPIFWDHGYGSKFPDMQFSHAAVLLTRVVSKLAGNRVCLDLGHKAIAAEMVPPRAHFLELEDVTEVVHSEEHLAIETPTELAVGELVYVIPRHICPTVALHEQVVVVEGGRATGMWSTTARNRLPPLRVRAG